MADALILEFTGAGEAEYTAVNKHLGIDMSTGHGDWPACTGARYTMAAPVRSERYLTR